jgi:hypothetical protein
MIWTEISFAGKRAAFCDSPKGRIYICERDRKERDRKVEAWVGGAKLARRFRDIEIAKVKTVELVTRVTPVFDSYKFVVRPQPVAAPCRKPAVEASHTSPSPPVTELRDGHCKCGVQLGRNGKCPALCEPVPDAPPVYTGPLVIGRTHIGRLAAPVI